MRLKIVNYQFPKSSFLSIEKDLSIIVDRIYKNENLKKLLYYTSSDALERPNLTPEQTASLFGNQIILVPKIYVDEEVKNYILITFDNFAPSSNPEFRNNLIEFDIVCHFDQWTLKDFKLRPYRIAAELDTMFNNQHLTGLGDLSFAGAVKIMMTDQHGGVCLMYNAVHGEEDKKHPENPDEETNLVINFDNIFNIKDIEE